MIDIKKITQQVEKQKQTILQKIGRLKKEDPFQTEDRALIVEPGTDAAQLFSHERIAILEEQLKRDLEEIEYALRKIKKGTYGICERCGKKIDEARLSVKPQAVYCMKCKSEVEKKN